MAQRTIQLLDVKVWGLNVRDGVKTLTITRPYSIL